MTKKTNWGYVSPVCEVLYVEAEGVLCGSTESGWGSTEDMGDLEDIIGTK